MLFYGHPGIILGSRWDNFGVILGSFWDHFGPFLDYQKGHFGIIQNIFKYFSTYLHNTFLHMSSVLFFLSQNYPIILIKKTIFLKGLPAQRGGAGAGAGAEPPRKKELNNSQKSKKRLQKIVTLLGTVFCVK